LVENIPKTLAPKTLTEEYRICAQCGYCNTICPTFQFWETSGPRGKLWTLRDQSKQGTAVPTAMINRLYECTLCGKCEVVCQTNIPLLSLWYSAREQVYENNEWPENFQRLHQSIEESHNIFGLDAEDRGEWSFNIEDEMEDHWDIPAETCYFVGCVTSYKGMNAGIAESVVELLLKTNSDFTLLGGEEWCCGSPYFVTGAKKAAKTTAQHNIKKMQELGIKRIITGCPGCYKSLKFEYLELLEKDHGIEILHTSEWMEKLIHQKKISFTNGKPTKVTYHDPCELGRHCGIYDAPRKILSQVSFVDLKEMETNKELAACCGGGGALAVLNEGLTDSIAKDRIKEAENTGAEILVTACPTCQFTFFKAIKESESPIKVLDLMEFLNKS
jgi:Fe-S oxidoreductase